MQPLVQLSSGCKFYPGLDVCLVHRRQMCYGPNVWYPDKPKYNLPDHCGDGHPIKPAYLFLGVDFTLPYCFVCFGKIRAEVAKMSPEQREQLRFNGKLADDYRWLDQSAALVSEQAEPSMTPVEFRQKINFHPTTEDAWVFYVTGAGEDTRILCINGNACVQLASLWNSIRQESEIYHGERFFIKVILHWRFPDALGFAKSRELEWFNSVCQTQYHFNELRNKEYKDIASGRFRVFLPTLKQELGEAQPCHLHKDDFGTSLRDASALIGNCPDWKTCVVFLGRDSQTFQVWKCLNMTRKHWVLLTLAGIGCRFGKVSFTGFLAWQCCFVEEAQPASVSWYRKLFGEEPPRFQWQKLNKDEVHNSVVLPYFIHEPLLSLDVLPE